MTRPGCLRRAPAPLLARSSAMASELPAALQGHFIPPTAEQKAEGWTQNWPLYWEPHDKLLASGGHPPTAEQAAKGWTQNWESWKIAADEVLPGADGEAGGGGTLIRLDFTGGATVRAAKKQMSKETHEYQLKQLRAMREAVAKHRAKVAFKPAVLLTSPLQSGATIPLLGLGTWKAKPGEVRAAVLYAITRAGYRHIDCAAIYENEGEVGSALEEVFSNYDIKREEIFITTKLWNNDHAAARVEPALRKCLKLLKLDYCDAFLIHWPITGNRGDTVQPPTRETWQAMEACQKLGLARHIGVSNFSTVKLRDIMSYATVPISIVQCESHPLWRNDEVVRFCEENRIHFTAFSPLGSPDSADIFRRAAPALMDEPIVHDIAARTGKNVGQVLIKWALQYRPHSSVLPKSTSESRILGNAAVLDWELSAADMQQLSSLPTQCRMVHGGVFLSPAGPYRTLSELWDTDEQ